VNPTIVRSHIHPTDYAAATLDIRRWALLDESRYVCAANVHMVMEAWDSADFREVINSADLVTPDGMPLVWILRFKGYKNPQRVYGPTLMLFVLEMAVRENIPVGFYGGDPGTLELLIERMQTKYPGLIVAYSCSPPFRVLTPEEDIQIISDIKKSGVRILFVGLGCPKQECWMAEHRGRIPAVMLGVGAAFNIHAGVKSQAPACMQRVGLEWLYRFFQEPRRLWRRYVVQNPRFVLLATAEFLGILKVSGDS